MGVTMGVTHGGPVSAGVTAGPRGAAGATGIAQVDHLVIAAARLEDGVAWCEATLGVTPGAGGRHERFGTHNRLLALSGAAFADCYLEIIAIDPAAPAPSRPRWFGLDEPALQQRLAREGAAFWHVVARCDDIAPRLARLQALGLQAGEAQRARRETPRGWLEWEIAVPADGRLPGDGTVPTWIRWFTAHPAAGLPPSGVVLRALTWRADAPVAAACALHGVRVEATDRGGVGGSCSSGGEAAAVRAPTWRAEFDTPLGAVTLESP